MASAAYAWNPRATVPEAFGGVGGTPTPGAGADR